MIGYNAYKIQELIDSVVSKYNTMGEKMTEGWSELSNVLENEWIGVDEVSYEKEVAKNICQLYYSATDIITQLCNNIKTLGDNWKNFQRNNVLEGAEVDVSNSLYATEIEVPTITPYEISNIVKAGNPSLNSGLTMGLKNGVDSANTIMIQYNTYIDGVYSSVRELYINLDTSLAFRGTELQPKVNEYLQIISESLAKITTCHKTLQERLQQLIAAYKTKESDLATEVSGATTSGIDLQGENLK